jgi:hypothetical protein
LKVLQEYLSDRTFCLVFIQPVDRNDSTHHARKQSVQSIGAHVNR